MKNFAELIYYAMEHGFVNRPLGFAAEEKDQKEQNGA